MPRVHRLARHDPQLTATLVARTPLRYAEGPDPGLDRPAHVRAASAIVRTGRGYVVVQDDASFLATVGASGVTATPLPAEDGVRQFDDLRGNKALKTDLEAACLWPAEAGPVLVAFGSGSTPRRERLLVAPLGTTDRAEPRFFEAATLYAALRSCLPAGAELNVEGAFRTRDGRLRLLQRGNGRGNVDATLEVDGGWLDELLAGRTATPRVVDQAIWNIGELGGVRLTLTDGTPLTGPRWLFSATAEASPTAVADGPVVGSVLGWADAHGGAWAPVTDREGTVVPCKLEGLALVRPGEVWGVIDADDPEAPSELLQVRLSGPWPT